VRRKEVLRRVGRVTARYRVEKGRGFRLADCDPGDTHELVSDRKAEAADLLALGVRWMAELQDRLYADDRWSLLLVFQAMDAAGKDGTIKHVMSGVNPQGVQVYSFKHPSAEELDHSFLWRYQRSLPERGRIGIFNRSYYEDVLVVRVHDEILRAQKLPAEVLTKSVWDDRYQDIRAFERHLARNGTRVLKFFLNVSREEQKKRFLERLENPSKNWKFSKADVAERGYWKHYMRAYEDAIRETADPVSPWYVVPADNKWFTRLVVAAAIVEALERLDLEYPKLGRAQKAELARAREALLKEK
jgi:PPK2 family polyphosphate:nucleotide phosphotransferase